MAHSWDKKSAQQGHSSALFGLVQVFPHYLFKNAFTMSAMEPLPSL